MRAKENTAVDMAIGARLRSRRDEMGLLQEAVAAAIGVSRQQIQKYESGLNALSPSRLLVLAEFLGVSPLYFLADITPDLGREYRAVAALRRVPARERGRALREFEGGAA